MNVIPKCLSSVVLVAASTVAPQAFAGSEFSYNYAQVSYVDMGYDYDGLAIAGSHDVHPQVAITASYMDTSSGNWDFSRLAIGASHHGRFEQLDNADLALHAEFVRGSSDGSNDENGIRLGAAVRLEIQPNLEMSADLSYSTLYENDLQFTPAVLLHITPIVAAEVSYQIKDIETLMVGARIHFK